MASVLNIIHSLTLGGAARVLMGTAKHSARQGQFDHHVAMVNLQATDPSAVRLAMEHGLTVPAINTRQALIAAMGHYDIVHVHWWQHPEMEDLLHAELPPCRLLLWFHVVGDKAPQRIPESLVRRADFAAAGSPETYHAPAFRTLSAEERLHRSASITGCTDFERLTRIAPQPQDRFTIGYVGTVNTVKIHPDFVSLYRGLAVPDFRVVVCGGDMQLTLADQAMRLGLARNFQFRGYVSDVAAAFSEMDVYGYPLCEDTYAASELNLQEAMFTGLVPVVFPYGGIRRLVLNDSTGLVVGTAAEYRAAIEFLYNEPEERARISRNAQAFAADFFDIRRAAKQMNGVYGRLLERAKSAKAAIPRRDRGVERFISSLGLDNSPFSRSAASVSDEETLLADTAISKSSPLMLRAGIAPYRDLSSADGHLELWTGLAEMFGETPVKAIASLLRSLPDADVARKWRVLWYVALLGIRLEDWQVARSALYQLIAEEHPEVPAKELLVMLDQAPLTFINGDLMSPQVLPKIQCLSFSRNVLTDFAKANSSRAVFGFDSVEKSWRPAEGGLELSPFADELFYSATGVPEYPDAHIVWSCQRSLSYGSLSGPLVVLSGPVPAEMASVLREKQRCFLGFPREAAELASVPLLLQEGGLLGLPYGEEKQFRDQVIATAMDPQTVFYPLRDGIGSHEEVWRLEEDLAGRGLARRVAIVERAHDAVLVPQSSLLHHGAFAVFRSLAEQGRGAWCALQAARLPQYYHGAESGAIRIALEDVGASLPSLPLLAQWLLAAPDTARQSAMAPLAELQLAAAGFERFLIAALAIYLAGDRHGEAGVRELERVVEEALGTLDAAQFCATHAKAALGGLAVDALDKLMLESIKR